MAEQETVLRFRTQAQGALAFWLADVHDELKFLTIQGRAYTLNLDGSTRGASQLPQLKFASDVVAASTNRVIYAGTATSEATLTAADTMSWDLIVTSLAVFNRKRMTPIRRGGKGYAAAVLSTEQMRDLRMDSDFKAIVAQAEVRGKDNPLFTNASVVVAGVVLYEHAKVFTTRGLANASKWGNAGTVEGAQAIMMGAQALGVAQLEGETPGYEESSSNDYHDKPGLAVGRIIGILKPQFPSKYDANSTEDYGTLAIKTAAK